jgi:hypothetical protein
LNIRRILGRDRFSAPEAFGPDGWRLVGCEGTESVIVSAFDLKGDPSSNGDQVTWIHASWAGPERVPTYDELVLLHRAVWGDDGYSYQVQAPVSKHINHHPYALHLWGRADGKPILPEFGVLLGTI